MMGAGWGGGRKGGTDFGVAPGGGKFGGGGGRLRGLINAGDIWGGGRLGGRQFMGDIFWGGAGWGVYGGG